MTNKLIIIGASGRMGRAIAGLAFEYGFELFALIDIKSRLDDLTMFSCLKSDSLEEVLKQDAKTVIIDFTSPESSLKNAEIAVKYNTPLVIGTTGFTYDERDVLSELAKKSPLFWSSNMSLGVNVLLNVLPNLVKMLGEGYDLEMVEIHHNKKKDSPSGTALSLAESLAKGRDQELKDVACYHREGIIGERPKGEIGVQTVRGGDVVGVHTAYFLGQGERIEITHQAHSRENFAHGSLKAAKWIINKTSGQLYSMQDLINEHSSSSN